MRPFQIYAAVIAALLVMCGAPEHATAQQCQQCTQTAASLTLPPGPIGPTTIPTVSVVNTQAASTFTATFSNMPTGGAIVNGTYLAWCPDAFADWDPNANYSLISTYNVA